MQAFGTANRKRFWWQLGIGVLNALVGLLLVVNPMEGVLTLTLLLSVLFLVEGGYKVVLAMPLRAVQGWVWLLASGLMSLLLGILIVAGLPGTAAWALGLMVGINLLFTGFALVSLARVLRAGPAP